MSLSLAQFIITPHQPNLWQRILAVVLPAHCVCCSRSGSWLCPNCYQLIHFNLNPKQDRLWAQDQLDAVYALAVYQPPLSDLIRALKYQRVKEVADTLAKLLYCHLTLPECDLVTWTPISRGRLSNRGFNQAALIGTVLSQLLNLPSAEVLLKHKETSKQARSSLQQRLSNLQDSIQVHPQIYFGRLKKETGNGNSKENPLQNLAILLLDDVVSTGATLNECARVLKEAGAGKVFGVAVGRS